MLRVGWDALLHQEKTLDLRDIPFASGGSSSSRMSWHIFMRIMVPRLKPVQQGEDALVVSVTTSNLPSYLFATAMDCEKLAENDRSGVF